jgi:hypothetical protein
MGNAAYKEGRLPGALLNYQAATKEDPCNPLLYNKISLVHLKMGKVTEVRSCCSGCLQHTAWACRGRPGCCSFTAPAAPCTFTALAFKCGLCSSGCANQCCRL